MIAEPLSGPGVKVMVAWPLAGAATRAVGAAGAAAGVTVTGVDVAPAPAAFTARRTIVDGVPFLSPGM